MSEVAFLMVNLFLLKFIDEAFFNNMTFFNIAIPMMVYLIGSLFLNLIDFMKLLHLEEMSSQHQSDDDGALISPKQFKLLLRVSRDLMAYFGIYYLSG